MWPGYLALDGVEIINTARTETYAASAGWFKPAWGSKALRPMLGDLPYVSPVIDNAPWYDANRAASSGFWGVYPIDVQGIDDFTGTTNSNEYLSDGGSPGRLRRSSKTVVVDALLVGADNAAVTYGMRWLTRALQGSVCGNLLADSTSLGTTLQSLASRPVLPSSLQANDAGGSGPDPSFTTLTRVLYNTKVSNGPVVARKHTMSGCTGEAWVVQFTLYVGNPVEFALPTPILIGYRDPAVSAPFAPGIVGGTADTTSTTFTDVVCGDDIWTPLFDPLCSALITPPPPPSVPLGCYTPPASWDRLVVRLPAVTVPLWNSVVPVLTLVTTTEVRNIRFRFYPDPDGTFDPSDDPCAFVSDWVVSYLPAGARMVIDSVPQTVNVPPSLGDTRRADSLVFRHDSRPIEWPDLSCGFGYTMTMDKPTDQTWPVVDLSFVSKAA